MSKYLVSVNQQDFHFDLEDLPILDIVEKGPKDFHVLHKGQSFHVSIVQADFENKTMTLQINGNPYQLLIEDEYDQLAKKMGLFSGSSQKIKNIKAPMPGLILDILIEPGQPVNKGDQLLILEAMKMENVLVASGEGVVKSVEVEKSMAVDKGQVLIEME